MYAVAILIYMDTDAAVTTMLLDTCPLILSTFTSHPVN